MSTSEYAVVLESFAERHFVKSFEKKHRKKWDVTWGALVEMLKRIDGLIGKNSYVETIVQDNDVRILKVEFRIAGSNESRRGSGNRCIVVVHGVQRVVRVLLVYCKNDVRGGHETVWWREMICDHHPQYRSLFH